MGGSLETTVIKTFHLTDQENEAQNTQITCSRSYGQLEAVKGYNPSL